MKSDGAEPFPLPMVLNAGSSMAVSPSLRGEWGLSCSNDVAVVSQEAERGMDALYGTQSLSSFKIAWSPPLSVLFSHLRIIIWP